MKKKAVYPAGPAGSALELKDAMAPLTNPPPPAASEGTMVRTQIYLSRAEHEFVLAEASRRREPMAAVIRSYIDAQMELPEEVWAKNPILEPTPADPDWVGHEDGALNHDHYVYGGPKKFVKRGGDWVPAPALPEGFYSQPAPDPGGKKSRRTS